MERADTQDWSGTNEQYAPDGAGRFDPVSRQRSIGDRARQEGRDRELTREKRHGASVREHVKAALRQEERKAGADIPNLQIGRVHEPQAQVNLVKKKQQAQADGDPWAMRDIPKPGEPKTHRQSVELAMETEKVKANFNEQHGITGKDDEVRRFRQATETDALTRDPHFQAMQRTYQNNPDRNPYAILHRELLKHPKDSFLTDAHRKMIGVHDGKRFDMKTVSPAGFRKLMGILATELPKVLERGRRTGQFYWG